MPDFLSIIIITFTIILTIILLIYLFYRYMEWSMDYTNIDGCKLPVGTYYDPDIGISIKKEDGLCSSNYTWIPLPNLTLKFFYKVCKFWTIYNYSYYTM